MKNDRQLQHDVLAELDREPGVTPGTIGAEVHHGTVKLSGSVADETTKKLAELAVRRVDGVATVIVDLQGKAPGTAAPRPVTAAPRPVTAAPRPVTAAPRAIQGAHRMPQNARLPEQTA